MLPRRYLLTSLTLATLLMGVIGTFNAWVDPYDLYRGKSVPGWTHFKTGHSGAHDRMVKAWHIRRDQPEVVLLGSSRVDWGLDEHHPALATAGTTRLNAGMGGATMYEMWRLTQHAVTTSDPKLLVIGLDIEAFNQRKAPPVFEEGRLAVDADGNRQWGAAWRDVPATLFTKDALLTSLRTVKASRAHRDLTREDLVRRGSAWREHRSPEQLRNGYDHALRQVRHNLGSLRVQQRVIGEQLGYFRALLALAHTEQMAVRLYIHPYHHTARARLAETDNLERFNQWKQWVVDANREAAEAAGAEPFPLRDFTAPHPIIGEPLPKDRSQPMTHWFESSHFRKATGDRVLDNLFGRVDDWGTWLEQP